MKDIYLKKIASDLGVKVWQVENTVELLSQGATVPFISRYRKERTGSLDDVAVAQIKHLAEDFDAMEKRKAGILETISAAGALTDELRAQIEECVEPNVLEDLYLPYRPKRRTKANRLRSVTVFPLSSLTLIGRTGECLPWLISSKVCMGKSSIISRVSPNCERVSKGSSSNSNRICFIF